jgi:tetratricopeptide (TPR) repeat protein
LKAWAFVAIAALAAGSAAADNHEVAYGPAPAWIAAPPAPTTAAAPGGAAVGVVFSDRQDRVFADAQEAYTAYRVKILAPDGLALGNITAAWNPSTDRLTVHELHIIRDGKVIDVLAGARFRVIEREDNLAYAMLDGNLTATLQTPGLEVGDELEFAATVRHSDKTFLGKAHGLMLLPATGSPGAYRLRLVWPDGAGVRWQATPDVGKLAIQAGAGQREIDYQLRDPASPVIADGAPGRANLRRLVEYSEFASWPDLATRLAPLFDKAAVLAPDSPVRLEAARIAASTTDPAARAEAALRLVEDRIRYVFVGLDGGDYLPAGADATWSRRFGDCKAKAVLLATLLRQLGVAGEIVLVNSKGGDGTNERLPSPGLFDHVVVRATIGAKTYWLDATRLGDRRLAALPAPVFRWDLPLRAGADLEATPAPPPVLPLHSSVVDIDATAGFDRPAKVRMEQVFRDDQASVLERILANLTPADAQEAMRRFWRGSDSDVQPDRMGWRYDFTQNALVLTLGGEMRLQWRGDDKSGRSLEVVGAGFTPPNEMRRPPDQDQTAPWATDFPLFSRWTTIVHLPRDIGHWRWDFSDAPVHVRLGGVTYWREAALHDGVLLSTMSKRATVSEITPAEAALLDQLLPKFDNAVSTVFEATAADEPQDHRARGPYTTDYAALRRMQAAAALKAGRPAEALAVIDATIAREPEDAANFKMRAEALATLGEREEALGALDEAWRIDPLDPALAGARAEAARHIGRSEVGGAPYDPWQPAAATDTAAPRPPAR